MTDFSKLSESKQWESDILDDLEKASKAGKHHAMLWVLTCVDTLDPVVLGVVKTRIKVRIKELGDELKQSVPKARQMGMSHITAVRQHVMINELIALGDIVGIIDHDICGIPRENDNEQSKTSPVSEEDAQ